MKSTEYKAFSTTPRQAISKSVFILVMVNMDTYRDMKQTTHDYHQSKDPSEPVVMRCEQCAGTGTDDNGRVYRFTVNEDPQPCKACDGFGEVCCE